jgi:hypothetical protein
MIRPARYAGFGVLAFALAGGCPAAAQPRDGASSPPSAARQKRAPEKPEIRRETGFFIEAVKDVIRARSTEFCERYGVGGNCIEEAEICLTMLDRDEDVVRVCMTMTPGRDDADRPRTSSLRSRGEARSR